VLDQETSGLEPYLSLQVTKKKVSGDWMRLVCGLMVPALIRLGYSEEQALAVEEYALANNSVVGSPYMRHDHYAIFDTAIAEPKADRFISADGHIKMLAAVQPALSGGMSKTINLPRQATVEDFENAHFQLWRLGVKAGAFYRDGSKATQPMVSDGSEAQAGPPPTRRHKLPRSVEHKRIKLTIPQLGLAPFEAYMMAGFYPNGQLGELFMLAGNEGSSINGFMAGACKQASLALQHGAPAENVIRLWMGMRFEPHAEMMPPKDSSFTRCASPLDLAARELALLALPKERRQQLGIFTREERSAELDGTEVDASTDSSVESKSQVPSAKQILNLDETPYCYADTCGGVPMVRIQGCHTCPQCGRTSGCS
jgi:ribonucleoside-diphosphate reductase alpha chain